MSEIKNKVKSTIIGCMTCGRTMDSLDDGYELTSSGGVDVFKDNAQVYSNFHESDEVLTVADINKMVKLEPDSDWRIRIMSAFWDRSYQWQKDKWVLYEEGQGYA